MTICDRRLQIALSHCRNTSRFPVLTDCCLLKIEPVPNELVIEVTIASTTDPEVKDAVCISFKNNLIIWLVANLQLSLTNRAFSRPGSLAQN